MSLSRARPFLNLKNFLSIFSIDTVHCILQYMVQIFPSDESGKVLVTCLYCFLLGLKEFFLPDNYSGDFFDKKTVILPHFTSIYLNLSHFTKIN